MAKTILLVEDDADTRACLRALLEDAGHQVVTARDGLEAWHLASKIAPPDLILLDVVMPRLSGKEFLQLRKRSQRWGGVPVVVMTGFDLDVSDAFVVRKPVRLADLVETVERAIRGSIQAGAR